VPKSLPNIVLKLVDIFLFQFWNFVFRESAEDGKEFENKEIKVS